MKASLTHMSLPSLQYVRQLLQLKSPVARRIRAIAKRLEALNEYHPEQALLVAADIVLRRVSTRGLGLTN